MPDVPDTDDSGGQAFARGAFRPGHVLQKSPRLGGFAGVGPLRRYSAKLDARAFLFRAFEKHFPACESRSLGPLARRVSVGEEEVGVERSLPCGTILEASVGLEKNLAFVIECVVAVAALRMRQHDRAVGLGHLVPFRLLLEPCWGPVEALFGRLGVFVEGGGRPLGFDHAGREGPEQSHNTDTERGISGAADPPH